MMLTYTSCKLPVYLFFKRRSSWCKSQPSAKGHTSYAYNKIVSFYLLSDKIMSRLYKYVNNFYPVLSMYVKYRLSYVGKY